MRWKMGKPNIQTVLNKFNEAPQDERLQNYDKIKISLSKGNRLNTRGVVTDPVVCTAPLSEPFKFSGAPQYTTFGDLMQKYESNPVGLVFSKIRGFATAGTMSADRGEYFGRIESAKLYKGVNDISFNFSFTCFEDLNRNGEPKNSDDEAVGDSILPFLVFTYMTFPNMPPEFMQKMNDIFNNLSHGGNGVWETIKGTAKGAMGTVALQLEGAADGATAMFKTIFGQTDGTYPSDHFSQKTQNCIDVEVSNICMLKNMVIKNFNATFSREVLENGLPVYTKYSLDVEPIVQPTNQELMDLYNGGGRYFSKFMTMAGQSNWGMLKSFDPGENVDIMAKARGTNVSKKA